MPFASWPAVIGGIFLGMISGDLNIMGEYFTIQAQGDHKRWELMLTPISDAVAAHIIEIVINGTDIIEQVLVRERNGDSTQILFTTDMLKRE